MRAISIDAPLKISIIDVAVPHPGVGDVAVDLAYVGYCGSDLTSFRGLNPLVTYPRVPGHEISGVVAELGESVSGLSVGQSVTILPYFNCERCVACRSGRPNACVHNQTMGVQREGAMTGRVVVPAGKVIPVDNLSARDIALIEPCAVGFHAVDRGNLAADETVVILGCGMIGLGALLGAVRRQARVIAVDLSSKKLEVARELGAFGSVSASEGDIVDRIRDLTGGDGPDVVIEAVGAEATFRQAVDIVASCGRVVYVGYAKAPVSYDTKQFLLKEMDLRGSRGATRRDFEEVIDELRKRPEAGRLIVSRVVPFADAPAAMMDWDGDPGAAIKILVDMGAANA